MTTLSLERYFKNLYPQFCDESGKPVKTYFDIFCKGVESAIMTLEHFRDEVDYLNEMEND